jgi:hypothetical protein
MGSGHVSGLICPKGQKWQWDFEQGLQSSARLASKIKRRKTMTAKMPVKAPVLKKYAKISSSDRPSIRVESERAAFSDFGETCSLVPYKWAHKLEAEFTPIAFFKHSSDTGANDYMKQSLNVDFYFVLCAPVSFSPDCPDRYPIVRIECGRANVARLFFVFPWEFNWAAKKGIHWVEEQINAESLQIDLPKEWADQLPKGKYNLLKKWAGMRGSKDIEPLDAHPYASKYPSGYCHFSVEGFDRA